MPPADRVPRLGHWRAGLNRLSTRRHVASLPECDERFLFDDEDQATRQWTIHAFAIGTAKARPSK
jgi:hypothetical protein